MSPERKGQDVWFNVPEAAKVLGVTRQAIYVAINAGQLKARIEPRGRKIHVQDLLAYGIKTGRDPSDLVQRVRVAAEADTSELLLWVLGGLGLILLIQALLKK